MNKYRTHFCNELRESDAGKNVSISGWVHRKRDHGNLVFVDLRDHYGITQCVVDKTNEELLNIIDNLRSESVIKISGEVVKRDKETINVSIDTGKIEISIEQLNVLSSADELPMPVFGDQEYPEDIRLKYRFLDIRREVLHKNLILRSSVISYIREQMTDAGFLEMQTPILTASSPEGARDYLVPSRLHPGKFYALPQAPQQFKQLIMAGGFDKYFQIAPCFRDEDARADRSPGEFYQLDVEMSFVEQEDVFNAIEPILFNVFKKFSKYETSNPPFQRLSYKESMQKYGTDKPDLRNPLELCDLTDEFNLEEVNFDAFKKVISKGGKVIGIPAPDSSKRSRSFFDSLNDWAKKEMNAAGLGYIILEEEGKQIKGKGPIAKFIPDNVIEKICEKGNVKQGDSIFFSCANEKEALELASSARNKIADELDIFDKEVFKFCWIVDFPMYEINKETGKIDFSHNPFSMPQGGLEALNNKDPLEILGYQYDIVCNGVELSSGAIRNHLPDLMFKAFDIAGHSKEHVMKNFGGMLNAFKYGAPPHGGIAPGIDRIVMLLAEEKNIREVILFPMNQQAQDLMMNAPADVPDSNLKDLNIRTVEPKED